MDTLKRFRNRLSFGNYDFRRLINRRILEPYSDITAHIICDIDKTYLETQSESAMQMIKIAFEEVKDKITVAGASPFLIAAKWQNPFAPSPAEQSYTPRSLHFVSASPPQLRNTLEEKLMQDGLDWNSDCFKNQAYNLRKGRIGLLRQHVAYKTAAVFQIMKESPPNSRFYLIGDSAEFDAYIYLGLALYLDGVIGSGTYIQYLLAGGVQSEVAEDLEKIIEVKPQAQVAGILIRQVPGFKYYDLPPLTNSIEIFDHYFQLVMTFIYWDLIDHEALWKLITIFHNEHNFSREALLATLQSCQGMFRNKPEIFECIDDVKERLRRIGPLHEFSNLSVLREPTGLQSLNLNEEDVLAQAQEWVRKLTGVEATK